MRLTQQLFGSGRIVPSTCEFFQTRGHVVDENTFDLDDDPRLDHIHAAYHTPDNENSGAPLLAPLQARTCLERMRRDMCVFQRDGPPGPTGVTPVEAKRGGYVMSTPHDRIEVFLIVLVPKCYLALRNGIVGCSPFPLAHGAGMLARAEVVTRTAMHTLHGLLRELGWVGRGHEKVVSGTDSLVGGAHLYGRGIPLLGPESAYHLRDPILTRVSDAVNFQLTNCPRDLANAALLAWQTTPQSSKS
ncbi:hypothetical protein PSPO01_04197 [Paraphaeosphaeria sporulosa]